MPLIRCPRCAQAYDIPGVVAVRLTNAIATCHCGEWLYGSKAQVLARMVDASQIREIDLQPYRIDTPPEEGAAPAEAAHSAPRSIRISARGGGQSIDAVFTIGEHPLWIGRKGCHVELAESELSLRHCSISLHGRDLVLHDADSHTGTFIDGEPARESVIGEGVHIIRAGTALITVEPTSESGTAVEPMALEITTVETPLFAEMLQPPAPEAEPASERVVLVCVSGPLAGQEFEIPPTGLVVGREGHVRVPDEFLSRRHFEVIRGEDHAVQVRDLGSRNGTFLNTLPARNTRVQAGDEITAGVNKFRVEERP